MAVAAYDCHPGLRETQLGSDYVHDALFGRAEVEQAHPELAAVAAHHFDLRRRIGIGDRLGAVGGRNVVILGAEGAVERAHPASAVAQGLEGLRRRHLVHQVQIDIKQGGFAGLLADHVALPDFFEKRLSRHDGNSPLIQINAEPSIMPPRPAPSNMLRRLCSVARMRSRLID